jgi:hypothetical protein
LGGRPPIRARLPPITARVGIDKEPPDLSDAEDVRWLLACTWPDTGRMARTAAAIETTRRLHPRVRAGDALSTLPGVLTEVSRTAVPCVFTTWALAYLGRGERSRMMDILTDVGRRRPLAWVTVEAPGVVEGVEAVDPPDHGTDPSALAAIFFGPRGTERVLLGYCQHHGAWLDWRA